MNPKLLAAVVELRVMQSFSEDVSEHQQSLNVQRLNGAVVDALPDPMIDDIEVF